MRTSSLVFPLVFSLLLACGPKLPSESMLQSAPQLPAPRAAAYASVRAAPADPVVSKLVEADNWNESLSGAAAGLALGWAEGSGQLSGWEVREAAWAAGWAWPITEVRGWIVPSADPPPEELLAWLKTVPSEDELGLVRARGHSGDAWVGLRSRPRGDTRPYPRQVSVGDPMIFPATPGVELVMADPSGILKQMALDSERTIIADLPGEWLVELRDDRGQLALFPIYAGLIPPEGTVLAEVQHPSDDKEASEIFRELLDEVRATYGRDPYHEDMLIQAAAASIAGGRTGSRTSDIADNLGYDPRTTWKVSCRGRTVTECADHILWNPRARAALLATDADAGLVARLTGDGVSVVVLVAAR